MAKGNDEVKRAGAIRALKFMREQGVLLALRNEPGASGEAGACQAYFELMNPKVVTGIKVPDEKKCRRWRARTSAIGRRSMAALAPACAAPGLRGSPTAGANLPEPGLPERASVTTGPELCGNALDDNGNGLADEGCGAQR